MIRGAIEQLGLTAVAAKYPLVEDVYVLEVCRILGVEPNEVTQEQRRMAKALVYGRVYGEPAGNLKAVESRMREGQF